MDISSVNTAMVERNKRAYHNLYKDKKGCIITAHWDAGFSSGQLDCFDNEELEFKSLIYNYNNNCEAVLEGFGNVPIVSIGSNSWLMALAYGCRLLKINGLINAAPLYTSVEQAAGMQLRERIYEYGIYPQIFERIERFQARWEGILITISDNQSPIDVLTSIFHSDQAMLAMFDDGEIVHNMLRIITHSIIEVNRHFEERIKNFAGFYEGGYLPFGMNVADDDAAFLSPAIYREFAKPYVEMLSDAFGGIAFHCCMGHEQNLANFAVTRGFMGFDAMPDYNSIDKVLEAISGRGVWNVYNYPWAKRNDRKETDLETFNRIITLSKGNFGLLLNVYLPNKDDACRLADQVREYARREGMLL